MKPTSEQLLEALADEARADAEGLDDARLQAVIRGSASRGERRALQDEARQAGIDVATLEAALRPMGPEARARVHELAARELVTGGSGAPPASERGAPTKDATSGATGAAPGATVSALPRRWTVIIGGLALAAALALFVGTRGEGDARVAAIPSYEVTVTGGRAAERGAPAAVALVPGARIVISLRPATPVEGQVEARAFLVRGVQRVPLDLKATVTAEGAVRLEGSLADLGPEWVGDAEVVASIARPGTRHEPLDAVVAGRQVVRAPVVVKAREPAR
ncbi:MAG: hypothetical protein WKG00_33190 [Polyangiaceae bacterium]